MNTKGSLNIAVARITDLTLPRLPVIVLGTFFSLLLSAGPGAQATVISTNYAVKGSYAWVAPAGVTSVEVETWGAGGGGGGDIYTGGSGSAGGGGAGGAYARTNAFAVIPGTTYYIKVGAAGAGGIGNNAGANGGDSWFSNSVTTAVVVLAKGGGGGGGGGATVGTGGLTNALGNIGASAVFLGGPGLAGLRSNYGGGGGGSAGNASSGNPGSSAGAAAAVSGGGPGGAVNTSTSSSGNAPASGPGGGGSGGYSTGNNSKTGGAGWDGQVVLTYGTLSPGGNWVGDGVHNNWSTNTADIDWDSNNSFIANSYFADGNPVIFNLEGATNSTVNLTTPVAPSSVTISSASNYVFTGSGWIRGTNALVDSGTGILTILTTNSYSGGTILAGGTLQIGNSNALGSGALTLLAPSTGVTVASYASGVIITNSVSANTVGNNAYGVNFDTTLGDLTLQGAVTASNAVVSKYGSNTLRLASSAGSFSSSGLLQLNKGNLVLDGTAWTNYGNGVRLFATNGDIVHLVITNGAKLDISPTSSGNNLRLGYTAGLSGTNELDISSGQLILDQGAVQIYVGDSSSTYSVVNQTGGSVLFQNNLSTSAGVLLGSSSGSIGWYYFNGGSLVTPRISGGSGTGYFYFNGGTLKPSTSTAASNFISGTNAYYYIGNGGAIIDTTNINLTVSSPLLNGGSGGLAKLGTATLTLAGTNTYVGATAITAGELIVPSSQSGGGAFSVADNAALGITVAAAGATLYTAALTSGTSVGTTTEFFLGATGSPASPVIYATNVTLNGKQTINLYGVGFSLGQFPLIKSPNLITLNSVSFATNLPAGVSAYISNNIAGQSIDLVVTAVPNVIWTGAANNLWDFTSIDWTNLPAASALAYADASVAQFDDTALVNTSITLTTNFYPAAVVVTNNINTYTFGGSGSIAGKGALTKSGAGILIVGTVNTYSGNTTINGGTLQLGIAQAIPGGAGAGDVTVNGTLDLAGNADTINGLNGGGTVINSTGSAALTLGANNDSGTFRGVIAEAGGSIALTKAGSGTMTLTANNNFSGGTIVTNGTLQLGSGASLGGGSLSLNPTAAASVTLGSYAGPVNLTNPVYVYGTNSATFNTSGGDILLNSALTATGPDLVKQGYNNLRIGPNGAGYSQGGAFKIYQGSVVVDGGVWTNFSNGTQFFANGNDNVRLIITNGASYYVGFGGTGNYNLQLGYTAGLTGTNELDVSSGLLAFGSSFRNINVGSTTGTYGVVNQTGGTILFAYASNIGVVLGNSANAVGQYYLNGGTLITPRVVGGGGSGYLYFNGGTLTPASSTYAGSFVSGLTAAYVGNDGAIFDTTNISVTVSNALLSGGTGGLTKLGVSTLALAGTNTYTGPTIVSAGELWLPTTQLGGGSISVADGAALGISLVSSPTLFTASLTLGSAAGATNEFNFGASANPTAPLVYATNLTVNGTVSVNVAGLQLPLGRFPLIKYTATAGLNANSFILDSAVLTPGFTAYVTNNFANSSVDLVVTTTTPLLWNGNISSEWDINTTANWLIRGTTQQSDYIDGTFVRFDDSSTGSTTVLIDTPVFPAGIWVSNNVQGYTLTGSSGIGGIASFTKDGIGTVVVGTANTYASNTVINAGTLQVGVNQAIPGGPGAGNVTVNGKLDLAGYADTINGLSGGGVIDDSTGAGSLTIGSNNAASVFAGIIENTGGSLALTKVGSSTLALTAANTFSGGVTLADGTLQIGNSNAIGTGPLALSIAADGATLASYSGSLIITNPVTVTTVGNVANPAYFDTTAGDLIFLSPLTATAATINKFGPNTLRFGSSAANFSGSGALQIYQGNVVFDGTTWTNGSGAVRLNAASGDIIHLAITNGATVAVGTTGGNINLRLGYSSGLAGTNEFDISSGQLILDQGFGQIYVGDSTNTYSVVNQTGGTILFQNDNASSGVLLGSSKGSTGWYYFNGGTLITPGIVGGSGKGYFYFNGGTLIPSSVATNNFFSGAAAAYVSNGGAIVDTTNINITISQPLLANGSGGLTKLGSASLTLSGTNTYTGATAVSNGTLVVNGSIGTNAVVVSGAALVGIGIINGPVTINTNATLILGSNDPFNTGTLTVSNNVTLAGNLFAKVNKSLVQSNDVVAVSGTLVNTGNGIVTISNAGPSLVVGDVFQLFSEPVVNGGRLSIASTPGTGLAWQNNLAVNGTVTVITPPVVTVNVLSTSLAGNQLTIQWPASYAGWILETQTNSLTGNNWVPVAGSGSVNQVTVTINPANGSVFYRLVPAVP